MSSTVPASHHAPPRELLSPTVVDEARSFSWTDGALSWGLRLCAALAGVVTLLIFVYICSQSFPLLQQLGVARFLTDDVWDPSRGQFSLAPMLVGTLYATLGAVTVGAPLGIALAVFAAFYAPPVIARMVRSVLRLLAGLPSVVFGFWGLVTLVPLLNQAHPPGLSVLIGIIILTLMILPTLALLAEAALRATPQEYLLGGAALGCERWQFVRDIAFPVACSGVFAAVLLGAGRAIGETMAVSMVMGNTIQIPESLLSPARTLTSHIALEMSYALGNHRAALFVAGLWLLSLVIGIVIVADRVSRNRSHEI